MPMTRTRHQYERALYLEQIKNRRQRTVIIWFQLLENAARESLGDLCQD
jgi:hypothetical protein